MSTHNMIPKALSRGSRGAFFLLICLVERMVALSAVRAGSEREHFIDSSRLAEVEKDMLKLHDIEVATGKDAFSGKSIIDADSISSWDDSDFIGRSIGDNNAGMDANYLPKNGNQIFESKYPVLSKEECEFIIQEARDTISQGLDRERSQDDPEDKRVNAISNSELGEARLSNMPKTREWLQETLRTRFYPLLKDRFGLDDVTLYDGLVMGNIAPTRSQPIHRDASLLTLNVALSSLDDYEGGGTYIQALDEILKIDQGHLLCHAGSAMHAGNAISSGDRWVFVLFLLGEKQPQLSRRCHAQAIEYIRERELDKAEEVLETGLRSIAQNHDHLLHNSMGRLQLMKGRNTSDAIKSFQKADEAYPICQEAMTTIARLMMDRRRPRADRKSVV